MSNDCMEQIKSIDSTQLNQLINHKQPPFLLDVRQPEEYEIKHIPGSVLIPLGQLEFKYENLPKDQPIVVYCRSGARSNIGANILCNLGFDNLINLRHGILEWSYETVTGKPQKVLTSEQVSSAIDVLIIALKNEIFGKLFYGNEYESTENEMVKSVLFYLADMEEQHIGRIYKEYQHLCDKHKLIPKDLDIIQREAAPLDPMWKEEVFATSDIISIVEQAVQWEYKAYDYYKLSAERIEEESIKSMLYDLAFEERAHASTLMNLLGRLAKA